MATLQYVVRATDEASAAFTKIAASADRLNEDLNKLDGKTATPKLNLEDKQMKFELDSIELRMAKLDKRVTTTHMNDDQIARARHEAERLSLALDKLSAKRTKIHVDSSALNKLSKASFLQPSLIGTAVALSPALIPLAAQVAAGVGAIGISFGAAALAAGGFGLMATTVLSGASKDLAKLQTLNLALLKATTAAQKKAAEQAITALKAGWSKGYLTLIDNYQTFQKKWKSVSQAITVPTLNVWLPVLTKGLQFLKPLIKPVADAFTLWGITLNTYFSDPVHAQRIRDLAAAFGNFAAQQLFRIGQFIKDIAQGVFNLGKDLAASGANFSAFGPWLSGIGDAFLNWSKSKKARDDVQRFMKFLHDEGPVVKGILQDLKTLLPGIFAGATTIGTLELQALGDFLNLVANLPKGWQKPLTEFAGAMLLLSKIGVVKVGLKFVGLEAIGAALPAAGGPMAAAGAAMAAGVVLKFKEDFKNRMKDATGALGHDLGMVFSGLGGFAATGAQGLADTLVNHFSKQARQGFHDAWHAIAASFDVFRHTMSASFAAFRHDLSSSFAALRHDLAASARQAWHDITSSFGAFRHTMSASFAALRHDIATAWDTIWRNTVTRTQHGITDMMRFINGIPGKIRGAFHGALTWLYIAGKNVIQGLWNGLLFIWHKVTSFIGSIAGWIKAHKGPIGLDAHLLEPAGRALMSGLHLGLLGGFGPVGSFISGIGGTIGSLLSHGLSAIFGGGPAGSAGGGVQQWRGLVLKALRMEGLSSGLVGDVLYQMQTESGGNPRAINLSDINAQLGTPSKGLMQVIDPTFRYWHWPGTSWNIYDPLANIAAAINYGAHGKGFGSGIGQIGSGHGYALGGVISEPIWGVGRSGRSYTFGERGPETVTPGTGRRGGPLLHIEHLHVRQEADVDLLARRLAFLDA